MNLLDVPAPLFRRFGAMVYDGFIVFSFWIVATALALCINQGNSLLPYQGLFLGYLFFVTGIFFSFFWHKRGQTLGMLAWRIALVDENQAPVSWSRAFLRYTLSWMSLLLGGLGLFWCIVDKNKQTLHDRLAKTKMVQIG